MLGEDTARWLAGICLWFDASARAKKSSNQIKVNPVGSKPMGAPRVTLTKNFATKFSPSYTDKNGAMAKSK